MVPPDEVLEWFGIKALEPLTILSIGIESEH